jgi:thioredoxin 1
MALRINGDNFEEKALHADKPVLLDFYSDTCIPCKRMAGTLADIEDAYENQIYVYKVNINYDADLAEQFQVMAAPTLVLLVNGEEKNRMTGAVGREQLETFIKENLE